MSLSDSKQILVIGSGPDAIEWWGKNGAVLGWHIVAINNVWKVVGAGRVDTWARSTDFFQVAKVQPEGDQLEVLTKKELTAWKMQPEWYIIGKTSGTMLLNVLCHILNVNEHAKPGGNLEVCVACSDFNYEGKETHWYGAGTPDPLRYGPEWLGMNLDLIKTKYKNRGVRLYNVGSPSVRTSLPFPRAVIGGDS